MNSKCMRRYSTLLKILDMFMQINTRNENIALAATIKSGNRRLARI